MNPAKRRTFLKTAATAAAGSFLAAPAVLRAAEKPQRKIKIGQIGTGHAHASGKMDALRKLTDDYEVVGIVEPDEELRHKNGSHAVYRDLKWMTEEQLLNTPELEAVAVETTVPNLIATVALMGGKPDKVTPFSRRTWADRDDVEDNMLAVLEYPKATCTVRSAIVEFGAGGGGEGGQKHASCIPVALSPC